MCANEILRSGMEGVTDLILRDVHHQLDRSEIGGEREAIRHELEQCYAGRPHV